MVQILFSIICGLALVIAGLVLMRLPLPDWTNKHLTETEQDKVNRWAKLQLVVRWLNNRIITVMGAVMVGTAAIPPGRVWVWSWGTILLLLLLCIGMAVLDAMASLMAYRKTLPSTFRATLGDHSKK